MSQIRPGTIAVRALNDYRKRSLFGYLALRHYLSNTAAKSDAWVKDVAVNIVLRKTNPAYFKVNTFKDLLNDGSYEYRPLHIPGPNEALAETFLLRECAKRLDVFGNPNCVVSYELKRSESRKGSYQPYIKGIIKRHEEIAKACNANKTGEVLYMDIRKFYPSIKKDFAKKAWKRNAEIAGFSSDIVDLGFKILSDYSTIEQKGILTGPMFSHFIANLVFREFDEFFSTKLPVKYLRYVDDITLIGSRKELERSSAIIRDKVKEIDLEFHPEESPKHLIVSTKVWLLGQDDYKKDSEDSSWIHFIGDLKKFLVRNPENRELLQSQFNDNEIRIPLIDYSKVVKEESFLKRFKTYARHAWFREKVNTVTESELVQKAIKHRNDIYNEYDLLLNKMESLNGFERKRYITKLRYNASRLIYLLDSKRLAELAHRTSIIKEMYFHVQVMLAVAEASAENIMEMGANAAQAFAQPMKNVKTELILDAGLKNLVSEQSAAIMLIYGINLKIPNFLKSDEPGLIELSTGPIDLNLMKNSNSFISELASLHGIADTVCHSDLLNTAFDEDEQLALDAIDLLQQYDSL